MKAFKKLLVVLVMVFGITFLTACGNKAEGIVGTWNQGIYGYTFNSDDTGYYAVGDTKMEFTYEDNGNAVKILYTGNTMASTYEYKIEGNKLIIKDSLGKDVEYIRK